MIGKVRHQPLEISWNLPDYPADVTGFMVAQKVTDHEDESLDHSIHFTLTFIHLFNRCVSIIYIIKVCIKHFFKFNFY